MSFSVILDEQVNRVILLRSRENFPEERVDVWDALRIGSDIDRDKIEHPSNEVYWRAQAAVNRKALKGFTQINLRKYLAHCRMIAKYYLKALGEKDTLEGRQDAVSLIYSRDLSKEEHFRIGELVHRGKLFIDGKSDKEVKALQESEEWRQTIEVEVIPRIYAYEDKWEQLLEYQFSLECVQEVLDAVGDAMKQRGYILSSFRADILPAEQMDQLIEQVSELTVAKLKKLGGS